LTPLLASQARVGTSRIFIEVRLRVAPYAGLEYSPTGALTSWHRWRRAPVGQVVAEAFGVLQSATWVIPPMCGEVGQKPKADSFLPTDDREGTSRPLASWGRRLIGYLADAVILGVPGFVLESISPNRPGIRIAISVLLEAALICYAAVFIGTQGRTLGMRLVSIGVVEAKSGRPITRSAAWVRALVGTALTLPEFVTNIYTRTQPANWTSHHHAFAEIVGLVELGALVSFLWPLWDTKNQTWQDKAASSVVINV
jgi:uncharacterized RDD family membrane protein YckC